ncbi:MAG: hypothetical protein ACLQME_10710 [Alphaproteobacteria bacterium]
MSETVTDAVLKSPTNRAKVKPRGPAYYRAVTPGLHIGFRKSTDGGAWVVRQYLGGRR